MSRTVRFTDGEPDIIPAQSNNRSSRDEQHAVAASSSSQNSTRVYLEDQDRVIVRNADFYAPTMSHADIIGMHQGDDHDDESPLDIEGEDEPGLSEEEIHQIATAILEWVREIANQGTLDDADRDRSTLIDLAYEYVNNEGEHRASGVPEWEIQLAREITDMLEEADEERRNWVRRTQIVHEMEESHSEIRQMIDRAEDDFEAAVSKFIKEHRVEAKRFVAHMEYCRKASTASVRFYDMLHWFPALPKQLRGEIVWVSKLHHEEVTIEFELRKAQLQPETLDDEPEIVESLSNDREWAVKYIKPFGYETEQLFNGFGDWSWPQSRREPIMRIVEVMHASAMVRRMRFKLAAARIRANDGSADESDKHIAYLFQIWLEGAYAAVETMLTQTGRTEADAVVLEELKEALNGMAMWLAGETNALASEAGSG